MIGSGDWSATDFEGRSQWCVSVDYGFHCRSVWFSGETAISQGVAVAGGLQPPVIFSKLYIRVLFLF